MTKDEALKLALEALDCIYSPLHVREIEKVGNAMKAIKEALAQPEQKPVAMRYDFNGYGYSYIDNGSGSNWREKIKNAESLYTAPSQRTWVELTDKEIDLLNYVQVEGCQCSLCYIDGVEEFARAIEAKLREKNGG